jgi:NADP-dependent 3-hydroxy acid dehydrogenase YdfG
MSKTIAIVGAGPGIGLATAERFGQEGFKVALLARHHDKLNPLIAQLKDKGIEAAAFKADVLDRDGLVAALSNVVALFGSIDVLEYGPSAAPSSLLSPAAIIVDNEQYHLDLTVLGAIAAVRAVLPGMLERADGAVWRSSMLRLPPHHS